MIKILVTATVLFAGVLAWAGEGKQLFDVQRSANMDLSAPTGYWAFPDRAQGAMVYSTRARMQLDEITIANRCVFAGQTVYASVTVPAVLTPTSIQLTGSSQNSTTVNGVTCVVSADAGAPQPYTVSNGVLTLPMHNSTASKLADL